MRTLKKYMTVLIAVFGFMACDKQEKPELPVENFSLTITEQNIQQTSAEFLAEPSNDEIPYVVANFTFDEISEKDDAAIVTGILADEKLNEKIHTKQAVLKYADLNPDTDYALIAFSYYEGKAGKVTKHTYSTLGKTPDIPVEDFSLTITEQNIQQTSAEFLAEPSNDEIPYVVANFAFDEISEKDDTAIVAGILADEKLDEKIHTKQAALKYADLNPGTDYALIAFSYYESKAGKVIKHPYSTLSKTPDKFAVDINVADITTNSATVTMVPNDDEIQYFGRVVTEHELTIFARTEEEAIKYLLSNPDHVKHLYTGQQTINFQNLQPGKAQVAVAFAYNVENPQLFAKKFVTDKSDTKTEFTITDLKPSYKSADMHVTPEKDEIYMETTVLPDYFDDPNENVMLGAYFGMQNAAAAEGLTLPQYIKKYGFKGEQDITINHHSQFEMEPGCEYVTYFYYVDPENTDPTNIYDWNYTAVRYKTLDSDAGLEPKVELINVKVVKSDEGEITFHAFVRSNANISAISWGPALYDSKWDQYLASEGWAGVAAVFAPNRIPQKDEVLEKTKTAEGFEYVWGPILPDEYGGGDVIFHVEGRNSQGSKCYTGAIFNENGIVDKEVKE